LANSHIKEESPLHDFYSTLVMRFHYTVCPFGLNSSPWAMLRVLLTVLGGKFGKSAFLYMDDICLADKSWLEHLRTLEDTLRTLQRNDLTCNPTKCELGMANLEFLGFQIGSDGVKISRKKLAVLEKLPAPKNRKGLQRILGFFNYWRRFLKDYSKHTYHMRYLLAKDTPFVWSKHCDEELQYLKQCLMSDPILQPFNTDRDLVIMTDASGKGGFGYQILQMGDDGQLHAIAYGRQALTLSPKNWTVAQLELYGLMISLRAYECFAIHKEVTVITDNSNVLHLDKWLPVNVRERRMITYLMQFRLKVKYLHGCHNASADCLSRLFTDMPPEDQKEFLPDLNNKDDFIVYVTDVVGTEATVLKEDTEDAVDKGDWVDYAVITDNEGRTKNLEDTEDTVGSLKMLV